MDGGTGTMPAMTIRTHHRMRSEVVVGGGSRAFIASTAAREATTGRRKATKATARPATGRALQRLRLDMPPLLPIGSGVFSRTIITQSERVGIILREPSLRDD